MEAVHTTLVIALPGAQLWILTSFIEKLIDAIKGEINTSTWINCYVDSSDVALTPYFAGSVPWYWWLTRLNLFCMISHDSDTRRFPVSHIGNAAADVGK
jgi:hypothetical protein